MKLLRGILNDFFYFLMCHTNVDYRNIQFFIPTTKSDQVIGKLVNRAPENMYTTGALIGAPLILQKTSTKIPLAPMGVLAPVSAHAGPSAQTPIDTSGNFPASVSAESPSNISHNPSEVISEVSEVYNDF